MATASKGKSDTPTIITPIGVACFPHIFEAHAFEDKEPGYSILIVFNKKKTENDPAWKKLREAVTNAVKTSPKFGGNGIALHKKGKLTLPWRDASEYEQYGEPFVEGNLMLNLKSRTPPGVVDERSQPIITPSDFYAGCLARASCGVWAYDTKGNKGVTLLLNNVQKAGDGKRLDGRRAAEDEFEALVEGGSEGGDEDLF